jgi:hypothetical protein
MVGIAIGTTTAGATIGITVGTRSARPWALPLAWLRFLSAGNQRLRWLSVANSEKAVEFGLRLLLDAFPVFGDEAARIDC